NTSGINNTGHGMQTLRANTTGNNNTANGLDALWANTTGSNNTANGFSALVNSVIGSYNTASGVSALQNSNGNNNTADGYEALRDIRTGENNIAVGYQAGLYLTNRSFNIHIGNPGVADDDNTIRLGTKNIQTQTFIAGISGATVASGVAVYVDANGHLGTLTSSARYKREIQSMDDASAVLFSLKPVTFLYKSELDPQEIPQFGLVAEDVEQIDPDLVARDDKNQIYTVRYEAVNAMLLNEFLKQHRQVGKQNTEIENLKEKSAEIQTLKAQNDSLAKRLSVLEQFVQSLAAKK
ncbi:MAG: hypothetical protein JWM99_2183, partial [Verrucomicrobiales bacterium]|nr:hypothetical protein [Verrucomicrobiales bacterium]